MQTKTPKRLEADMCHPYDDRCRPADNRYRSYLCYITPPMTGAALRLTVTALQLIGTYRSGLRPTVVIEGRPRARGHIDYATLRFDV